MLVNARHVKNLPGPKTDVADATWLAQLGAHGLVRASFVPPAPSRELRDLTRARTAITRERGREVQRLEKLLEDAGIKLSSVASDITVVWGRAMLEALIAGDQDPAALADLADWSILACAIAGTTLHRIGAVLRRPHKPRRLAPHRPLLSRWSL
jgi:transposase